jgi:hypothetical protein
MKQTAVEWLQGTWLNYPDLCTYEKIQEWFDRAKAMEKEQIINAHLEGWSDAYDYLQDNGNKPARQAEEYYNETYNK